MFFEWLVKHSETLPDREGHRGSILGLCQFGLACGYSEAIAAAISSDNSFLRYMYASNAGVPHG